MGTREALSLSRRRFLATAGIGGLAGWLVPRDLLRTAGWSHLPALTPLGPVEKTRQAAATGPITVQPLRGGINLLVGAGSNIAVLPGPDGVVLVDGGIVGRRVAHSVAGISKAPVQHVINTHWHFDHTDANAWWRSHGAIITAHENTRKHMATTTRVEDWDFTFPPAPKGALPANLVSQEKSLQVNRTKLQMKYYGPCHTDSDISVHFTAVDVLHVGDTWWNGLYPFIDYSTGGSIEGMIRAAENNLARVSSDTIVVPGHGRVGGRAELTQYRDMLVAVHQRVAALKKEGRPLADVIAAKPTAAFDATWSWSIIDSGFFTRLVYQGVS